jgi:protein tyrosine phosphatase (PTP) superfamily phosphohydrolase (DUF442 family)
MGSETITNFIRIDDTTSTGGMPTKEQLEAAAAEGCEVVINLATYRIEHSLNDEAAVVQALGMDYHAIPVAWDNPTENNFLDFERLFKSLTGHKVLVHCAANYRVTAFYALYALKNLGWTPDDAAKFRAQIWRPGDSPVWEAFIRMMENKILAGSESQE